MYCGSSYAWVSLGLLQPLRLAQLQTSPAAPACAAAAMQFGGMTSAERNSVIRVRSGGPAGCVGIAGWRLVSWAARAASCRSIRSLRLILHPTPPPQPHLQLVINISSAFAAFERWSVGLGVEHQLSALRRAVGLPEFKVGLVGERVHEETSLLTLNVVHVSPSSQRAFLTLMCGAAMSAGLCAVCLLSTRRSLLRSRAQPILHCTCPHHPACFFPPALPTGTGAPQPQPGL